MREMADLIADVGNTRAHLALFEGPELRAAASVAHGDAMRSGWDRFLEEHSARPARFALATVQAEVGEALRAWSRERWSLEPLVLGANLAHTLPLEVERPEQVGADRIANGLWAARTHPGRAVVVIDLGTAVTFDVVASSGAFRGGIIAAGMGTCARALADRTSKLPHVTLHAAREDDWPPSVLGRTTEACLEGGLLWGAVGLVNTVCARIAVELGEEPLVVATGGDAEVVAPHCPGVDRVVPRLTLHGVRIALAETACG